MAESTEKTKETEGLNIWQVATVVLAVALLLALYWGLNRQGQVPAGTGTNVTSCGLQPGTISAQQAADKTVKYINDYLMQGTGTATLNGVVEGTQFYEVNISISGQSLGLYATKDGKFFVVTNYVYDLDKPIEVAEPPAAQTIPKTDNPEVYLYTMAYCPYGNQAEDAMAPVVKLLGSKVEV
ncbi:MAG: hypothetical protein NT157_01590, partial [Candidatus Micrarchaeota archaeon]|nr:hypothetical protein [Candidatus Micrarchaeota archaeon]